MFGIFAVPISLAPLIKIALMRALSGFEIDNSVRKNWRASSAAPPTTGVEELVPSADM